MTLATKAVTNPGAETLLDVLRPFLRESVLSIIDLDVPGFTEGGVEVDRRADVFLSGEYETVVVRLTPNDASNVKSWQPAYPLGLLTDVYTLPESTLFYFLDEVAYLIAVANPSLFQAGTQNVLAGRVQPMVRSVAEVWSGGGLSIAFPGREGIDLEFERTTAMHRDSAEQGRYERAA